MEHKKQNYTAEGYQALLDKLESLKIRREENKKDISTARSFGDLSENSEYDEAKEAQAFLEYDIAQLEERLRYARVISDDEHIEGRIGIGSVVTVEELEDGKVVDKYELTICGDAEEDPANNKISYQAPVGKGLMGCEKGQTVNIEVPMGILTLRIVNVKRP